MTGGSRPSPRRRGSSSIRRSSPQRPGRDPADVEERLQRLDRVHGLVRLLREDEFADRTLTLRYSFVHVLYQQALVTGLPPTRRRAISRALAEAWRDASGRAGRRVRRRAGLPVRSRTRVRARSRAVSSGGPQRRTGFRPSRCVALARHGLHLLKSLPASPEQGELELPLQTMLGLQLQVTEGYASPAAEAAYERARELCADSPATLFPVLWGLWLVRKVRSDLPTAQELAGELLDAGRPFAGSGSGAAGASGARADRALPRLAGRGAAARRAGRGALSIPSGTARMRSCSARTPA